MTEEAPKAGRREWIGLAVIALPCLLYSMDLTVLNLAVPQLSADLEPSSSQLLWIVDIYGFLVAGSLITMGTLGDRIGRRRLLLIGAAAFGVASVLTAFSTSAEMLIGARALLGLAGATLAPSTLSLIRNMFLDPHQRTVAVGVWAASYSAGAAVGPVLGGVLLEFFWWGSVFLLAVPVMVLLLAVGPRLLPEYRDPDAGRLDIVSALQSLAAVLAMIYGLKQIAEDGFSWTAALLIVTGLAIGVLFVRRQHRLTDPLIELRLFRAPAFSASLGTYGLAIFAVFGSFLFLAQYLQLVRGMSPLEAGVWSLPASGGFVVGSMLAPPLARRLSPVVVVVAGLVIGAAGMALLTQVDGPRGLAFLVGASATFATGIALVVPLTTDIMIGTAPPERAGAASALSETGAEFGGALGIAVLGSIGTAVYRGQITDRLPADVPADAAEAARESLGGAVAAADQLASGPGAALFDVARDAFLRAFQIAALSSAVVVAATAVLAAVFLRHARSAPPGDEATRPDERETPPGDEPARPEDGETAPPTDARPDPAATRA
jgi:DHA2 family multidrug resistance protein-like MFS transporter